MAAYARSGYAGKIAAGRVGGRLGLMPLKRRLLCTLTVT